MHVAHRSRVAILPTTPLGRWGLALAAVFPLVFAAGTVPLAAALGLLCALAGGGAALAAIVRRGERAVTVFAALVPLAIAVAFVLAEVARG